MYKEVIISVIIVALIFVGDFFLQKHIEKSVENLKNNMYYLKDQLEVDNKKEAEEKLDEINIQIENFHKTSAFFIEHDELEKVESNFTTCESFTRSNNFNLAISELNKTIFVLEHIADKYAFDLENIF